MILLSTQTCCFLQKTFYKKQSPALKNISIKLEKCKWKVVPQKKKGGKATVYENILSMKKWQYTREMQVHERWYGLGCVTRNISDELGWDVWLSQPTCLKGSNLNTLGTHSQFWQSIIERIEIHTFCQWLFWTEKGRDSERRKGGRKKRNSLFQICAWSFDMTLSTPCSWQITHVSAATYCKGELERSYWSWRRSCKGENDYSLTLCAISFLYHSVSWVCLCVSEESWKQGRVEHVGVIFWVTLREEWWVIWILINVFY